MLYRHCSNPHQPVDAPQPAFGDGAEIAAVIAVGRLPVTDHLTGHEPVAAPPWLEPELLGGWIRRRHDAPSQHMGAEVGSPGRWCMESVAVTKAAQCLASGRPN